MKPLKFLSFAVLSVFLSSCVDGGGDSGGSSSNFCETGQVSGGSCPSGGNRDTSNGPILVSSNINSGDTVDQNIEINLNFSEAIASYSVVHNSSLPGQSNSLSLKDSQSGEEIGVDVYLDGTQMRIRPYVPLEGGRVYHLSLSDEIVDINGQTLEDGAFIAFDTKNNLNYGTSGETVLSWTQEHEERAPVSHYVLSYGAYSSIISDNQDFNFEWPHQKILRPSGLDDAPVGMRSYHVTIDNEDLPGTISGVYNYFVMQACNENYCSRFSNEANKYLD